MWKLTYGIGSVVILLAFGAYFWPQLSDTASQVDLAIPEFTTYLCADGKNVRAAFLKNGAQLLLSDGRYLALGKAIDGDEGTLFTDGELEFWTKDYGAFIFENGTTTYAGCVVSSLEFPNVESTVEPADNAAIQP